jgi:hypothetical protein
MKTVSKFKVECIKKVEYAYRAPRKIKISFGLNIKITKKEMDSW